MKAPIKTTLVRAACALTVLGLTACSGSGTSPITPTQQNLTADVLQLSVGTANIYGAASPNGLNVVTTYRQPGGSFHPGDSAVGVSSPSLSGPSALPHPAGNVGGFFSTIESGPAPAELGTHVMTSTSQTGSNPTTFGKSGGVFGLGIEPWNYNGSGSPDGITPYQNPLYDSACGSSSCPSDPNAFVPWGGPPAFPNQRTGSSSSTAGQQGISEGLDVFANMVPASGAYTLNVTVPANTGSVTQSANASIGNSSFLLPVVSPPTPALDGNGGASVSLPLPAGVTEAYVQIVDVGPGGTSSSGPFSCNGSSGGTPTWYTVFVKRGATSGKLGDSSGPGNAPSICTSAQNAAANPSSSNVPGDSFTVQVIGFDYPIYEASYPKSNGNPKPNIAGASGQSDISISPAVLCGQAASGGVVCGSSSSGGARLRKPH